MAIEEIPSPKKPWQSKTNWMALIFAVSAFVPVVQGFMKEHAELYGMIIGVVFSGLRQVSNGKISIE
jgi:hypothetical protein